jgi:hypothetical protein
MLMALALAPVLLPLLAAFQYRLLGQFYFRSQLFWENHVCNAYNAPHA